MSKKGKPVPPPDKDAELAILKLRVHAAEALNYAIEERLRQLLAFFQPLVKKMHELNKQFPLGDDSPEAARAIAVNAIRAKMPDMADKSEDEILKIFFSNHG